MLQLLVGGDHKAIFLENGTDKVVEINEEGNRNTLQEFFWHQLTDMNLGVSIRTVLQVTQPKKI